MTAAEPQEDEMTERPSDIERAARVCEELAAKAGRHAESCADVDRETSDQFTEAETWLVLAAEDIRALPPSPLAEENARLIAALAECFRLSGAEPGSDDEWTLAARAVDAVRRLREDYDEVDPIAEAERRLGRFAVTPVEIGHDNGRGILMCRLCEASCWSDEDSPNHAEDCPAPGFLALDGEVSDG